MKFRTKPFEIEAIQWTGDNGPELAGFVGRCPSFNALNGFQWISPQAAEVWDYLQGTWVKVNPNDWIIKGMKGEFYPCADEVFQAKYEAVTG